MDRRVIVDLLLGVSLTLSLFLAVIAVPVLGLSVGLFTPLPIAFYFRKTGIGYGILMLGAVFTCVTALAGIRVGGVFLAEFALMGVALSESARRRLPIGKGVMISATASLVGGLLLLAVFSPSFDKGVSDVLEEHIRKNVSGIVETYKGIGLPEDQLEDIRGVVGRLETFLLKTFPSLFFIGTLSVALLNLLALKGLLERKGLDRYQVDPTLWRSPDFLVWVLIAGGFLLLLDPAWAKTLGLNLLVIAGGIYLFQGLAIMAFYFKKMGTPLFLRGLGYLLIFIQQIFTILVIVLGLFDLWFDFRRLKKEA